jgi:hypothetical protein
MISNIDELLANSFEIEFENNLGNNLKELVRKRLFEKYGVSLLEGIRHFEKFEDVLSEIYHDGYKGIIQDWLEKICIINGMDDLEIINDTLRKQILSSYNKVGVDSEYSEFIKFVKQKIVRTNMTVSVTLDEDCYSKSKILQYVIQ